MNRLIYAMIVATMICAAAWILVVFSVELTYLKFMGVLFATAVWGVLVALCCCPSQQRRKTGFRLAAISIGTLVGVGVWELVAFAWPTDHLADNPWYLSTGEALVADPDLPWLRPPHLKWTGTSRGDLAMETNSPDPEARIVTFQTDYQGFRNARDLAEAEIVFIGDSFTEAGNVPEQETYVHRVGSQLGAVTRNLGVAGFSTPSELIVLHRYGLPCRPRVVVWQIAETNDLDDAVFFAQWQQAGRPSVLPGFSKAKPTQREAWQRRSPTQILFKLCGTESPWPFSGDFQDNSGTQHTIRFEMSFPPDAGQHPGWMLVEQTLAMGAQTLKANDVQLVVLMIPTKLRVMAPHTDFHSFELNRGGQPVTVQHTLPGGWELNDEARLATHLQHLCDRLEVTFVDATTVLSNHAAAGQLVYQSMDTHLSSVGHEVVAGTLVQTLERLKPPPSESD
jgi:hypothetical protein